jgi:hypothetical protein
VYERLIERQSSTDAAMGDSRLAAEPQWLSPADLRGIEASSADHGHPIEQVLTAGTHGGWRAAQPGRQVVRVHFRAPRRLRRVVLEFRTSGAERTQEYALRCRSDGDLSDRELVRQQWNFSRTAPCETEDHCVDLAAVTTLEIEITPDVADAAAYATLARLRLA